MANISFEERWLAIPVCLVIDSFRISYRAIMTGSFEGSIENSARLFSLPMQSLNIAFKDRFNR